MADIILVEDEEILRRTLARALVKMGHQAREFETAEEALAVISEGPPDLLFTDNRLPGMSGMELMTRVHESWPDVVMIMMTAYGTVEDAVKAMRDGAADYLRKPVDLHELALVINRCLEGAGVRRELEYYRERDLSVPEQGGIIGRSPAIDQVRQLVTRLAGMKKADGEGPTLLLAGETGTGKGLVARAVHNASPRADQAFIEVNCTAIPENLLEAELMGYEKGAFTDANSSKTGLVEASDGGTLFLDEIGHMARPLQSKLLKIIDEKIVRRLGSTRDRKINCTIVAASHMDLEKKVAEGTFLEDLFHRINVVNIKLPALREREGDIEILAQHFLEQHATDYGMAAPKISDDAMRALLAYPWPGNIRELSHTLERALVMHSSGALEVQDLAFFPAAGTPTQNTGTVATADFEVDFSQGPIPLETVEANLLTSAMKYADNNQVRAAKLLGMSRDTLRYRLDKHSLR